jgi:hypothetical protein
VAKKYSVKFIIWKGTEFAAEIDAGVVEISVP